MRFRRQLGMAFSILLMASVFLFLFAGTVDAQGEPSIVPQSCQDGPCTFCEFFALIHNILKWLLVVGVALAGLAVVYGGLMYILSQGNESKVETAKSVVINAVLGIAIMAVSFLIVTTIIQILAGGHITNTILGGNIQDAFSVSCGNPASP